MKSICRMLKYTNINNISRDVREYSRTRKMESSRLRRGRETFFAAICPIKLTWQCRRINSRRVPPGSRFSRRSFSATFLRPAARLIGKDCVSLRWLQRDVASPTFSRSIYYRDVARGPAPRGEFLSPSLRRSLPRQVSSREIKATSFVSRDPYCD